MQKPNKRYRKGSKIRSLLEDDWEDLTVDQIAEVLYSTTRSVWTMIRRIKKETGYVVPHARKKRGEVDGRK